MKNHLKAAIVAVALTATMFFLWEHYKGHFENKDIGKQTALLTQMESERVPAFELKNLRGESVSSEIMKGKLAFVNFWASWCDPCVREFPSMLQLVKHFKGELILVAISNDENKEDMLNFVKAFGADQENVYVLWDPDRQVAESFGTFKLPETFMVGPDLKLIRKIVGVEKWFTDGSKSYLRDVIDSFKN